MKGKRTSVRLAKLLFDGTVGRIRDPRLLGRISSALTRTTHAVNGRIRQVASAQTPLPVIESFDRTERLAPCVLRERAHWKDVAIRPNGIPGMITDEERRYYAYLPRFYSGKGEVVELGPWLGCSTSFIVSGLRGNPRFAGRKLHVFDDFVWRSRWMNHFVRPEERLENHGDFRPLFEKYAADLSDSLEVQKRRILTYDGNAEIPQLAWNGGPIEMMFVDCGRLFHTNEAWYRIFSPSFIPDVTLIAMQDWRLQFEVPVYWENQTKNFTDSKGPALELVHELKNGTTATFLYRGGGAGQAPTPG